MARKREDEVEEKVLDVTASMEGTIAFKDPVNLRINGEFNGKLETHGNLTIGENAKVKASIEGDKIVVAGKVTGDIHASQSLSVVAPAEIQGNIFTPSLSVTEGAIIEGNLNMLSAAQGSYDLKEEMSLRDVAHYLEVDVQVVEDWARKKKVPSQQQNGTWTFRRSEIDKWVAEEKVTA
jgi:cytoskeletal protein CcmA (bactofilin family)